MSRKAGKEWYTITTCIRRNAVTVEGRRGVDTVASTLAWV